MILKSESKVELHVIVYRTEMQKNEAITLLKFRPFEFLIYQISEVGQIKC